MSVHQVNKTKIQTAEETPWQPGRNEDCILVSTDIQTVIEELCAKVSTSASPGFTWGKAGTTTPNTWLLNDNVPSNKSGRLIFLTNAYLTNIFVSNELNKTFDIEVYEHDGTNFTLLTTVNLVNQRSGWFNVNIALTTGKELAMKLSTGSAKNITAGCIIEGTL